MAAAELIYKSNSDMQKHERWRSNQIMSSNKSSRMVYTVSRIVSRLQKC